MCRFLKRFPADGGIERLTGFKMACWLVQPNAFVGVFFDQEELSVPFDNSCDRYFRFPDHVEVCAENLSRGGGERPVPGKTSRREP